VDRIGLHVYILRVGLVPIHPIQCGVASSFIIVYLVSAWTYSRPIRHATWLRLSVVIL